MRIAYKWSLGVLLLFVLLAAHSAEARQKNVLFFFSDDQRRDTIGAWGNEHIKTPNLDRLVREGMSFKNNYCQGSMQGAVCHPSRAMLMTGRTLFRIDTAGPLWPEVMRAGGYNTFASGKLHGANRYFNRMFSHGDQIFFGGMGSHTALQVNHYDPSGKYDRASRQTVAAFTSEAFCSAASEFLKNRSSDAGKGDDPFFVYVSFTAPHDPRTPPEKYRRMYDPEKLPVPENFLSVHPFHNGWMTGRDERLAAWPRTKKEVRQNLADYYGMISHMDAQIGRVLQTLRDSGEYENTIIIFAGDHGLAIGSHGLMGKQNVYEHSMGTPLIFSGPGIPRGTSSDALVYLFDLFPTVCDLVGLTIPASVEGKSLAGILRGQSKKVRDSLYTAYEVQRAVRDERWKFIRHTQINKSQLFDLQNDPHEIHNLADDSKYAGKVDEMMNLLAHWQAELGTDTPLTATEPKSPEFVPPSN